MRRVVASLAAVVLVMAGAGCGDDGAEPGASDEATLVLDFQPNAVHAGIYAALADGGYDDAGVDLTVREPSSSRGHELGRPLGPARRQGCARPPPVVLPGQWPSS